MANVLIIDDDVEIGSMLVDLVTSVNHRAEHVITLKEGVERALTGNFDIVFLDVRMPDGSGLDVIPQILGVDFPPEIIVITGQGDSADAETAITKGAWDYIQKPLSPKKIIQPLNRILEYRDGIRSVSRPSPQLNRDEIVGSSNAIRESLAAVAKAAHSNANVLITGETGTGKELFARAIHNNSDRRDRNFIVIDCAALPETLAESALFGHEKGAFTGADRTARGLISLADGGTLFLDEVGEMNLNLQKVFLRVLQERKFRPVGSKHEVCSDFRLIAATNRNPASMVKEILFREDLLYRLNAIPIKLPPLRERIEDIEELTERYIMRICLSLSCEPKDYSLEFITTLQNYDWPGNVRQLVNSIESAVSEAYYEPTLFSKHLPHEIRIKAATSAIRQPLTGEVQHNASAPEQLPAAQEIDLSLPTFKDYRRTILQQAERTYLKQLMQVTHGNIKKSCAISGLGRTRLYTLLKENNIDRMGWD
jgi:two-component system NtrC family response regulator